MASTEPCDTSPVIPPAHRWTSVTVVSGERRVRAPAGAHTGGAARSKAGVWRGLGPGQLTQKGGVDRVLAIREREVRTDVAGLGHLGVDWLVELAR
eukprot:scaffold13634_cov108-Isochrysis_galbana.AAC.1